MANLRPGGRAVVALPEGPLFRLGSDKQVRKTLMSEFSIDSVVSLPAGAFAPWTGIAASLVVFRRATRRSMIRFIRISSSHGEQRRNPATMAVEQVSRVKANGSNLSRMNPPTVVNPEA